MNFEASNAITKRLKNLDFFWKTSENGIPKNAILDECYHLLYKQLPDLELELKNNFIENAEKAGEYCANLLDDVTEVYDLVNSQNENKDLEVSVPDELLFGLRFHKKDFNEIRIDVEGLVALCSYSLRKIIETLKNSLYDNSVSERVSYAPTKILFLQFSGILETIKKNMELRKGKAPTNVEVAAMLVPITGETESNLKVLLTQIAYIEQGKPYKTFKPAMIKQAIKDLSDNGFDTIPLQKIELKMNPTN